jgi:type IX secretion system PorP/SprF family membrane protein
MESHYKTIFTFLFLFIFLVKSEGQENYYSHYFAASSMINPAFAGDTRFGCFQIDNRLTQNTSAKIIRNTMVSYSQKLPNYRSGLNVSFNQNSKEYKETQVKGNYSYTVPLNKKYWLKTGVGFSMNFVNSNTNNYLYPDQFDQTGLVRSVTVEPSLIEADNYPAFAAGFILYNDNSWLSVSSDYLNRPKQNFAGQDNRVPIIWSFIGSYMISIDKNKKTKRIFSRGGGLIPYSSIGPIIGFSKQGPFNMSTIGFNAFLRPIFFGVEFHNNSFAKNVFSSGIRTIEFIMGYRNESISLAYSYDFRLDQNTVNYRGAHEISLVYYLYTTKKDRAKNKLVPLPNQLMY